MINRSNRGLHEIIPAHFSYLYLFMLSRIFAITGLWVCLLASLSLKAQFYQGSYNEFGKNRVQYRDFLWQQYRFEEFDTYFYEGGQQLAEFTSRVAAKNMHSLEEIFDFPIRDKIQFVVYNSHTDFKQSNIGITGEDEQNIGGTTQIVGSKVFVYFEGDYVKFEQNIRKGIARVLINQRLYGGNWRDVIKSSTLLNLPDWYIEGLILYASKAVEPDMENIIRSGILEGDFEKLNRLQGRQAEIAGYAMWRYVAEVYGENIIPNVLYMSGVSRNVESGFLFVLGKSLDTITREFIAYYRGEYGLASLAKMEVDQTSLEIKTKKNRVYTTFKVSPDGRYALYVSNILGQYRLYLYDHITGKRKKILKDGHKLLRIPDYSFPVLTWHPSSEAFTYVKEWRGRLMLVTHNLDNGKETEREVFALDEILDMAYSPNGQQIVLSATDNGQTDLYLYYMIGNRQERLTNDFYGDFHPSFSKDGSKVIFSSNRIDDTLRVNVKPYVIPQNRDVFAYNILSRSPILERITDTPDLIEKFPHQYDDIRYTFIAEFEGIQNRYVATYDSAISRIDTTIHYRYFTTAEVLTNYRNDILDFNAYPATGQYGFMTYSGGEYRFYMGTFQSDTEPRVQNQDDEDSDESSRKIPEIIQTNVEEVEPIVIEDEPPIEREVDMDNYRFEGEPEYSYERETITLQEIPSDDAPYRPSSQGETVMDTLAIPGARNYNINFTTDKVLAQLDNTFMTEFYQPLSGAQDLNPGLSGLIKFATSDLFEDYRIVGGFRLAGNFDNNTVMLMGEDLSRRMDRRLQLFRQQARFNFRSFNEVAEVVTYQAAYRLSWPFNEVFSVRGSGMYRFDNQILLATDRFNAQMDDVNSHYLGLKGELVFDNTLPMGLNLRRGMRWKIWAEYYRDPLNTDRTFMTFGGDWRNYLRIHRNLILASRVGWSTSLGSERLVFFLGSVDNVLNPREDNSSSPRQKS
jgi:hypothetical protein